MLPELPPGAVKQIDQVLFETLVEMYENHGLSREAAVSKANAEMRTIPRGKN